MEKKLDEILKSINDLKSLNSKIITNMNKYGEKCVQISKKIDDLTSTIQL